MYVMFVVHSKFLKERDIIAYENYFEFNMKQFSSMNLNIFKHKIIIIQVDYSLWLHDKDLINFMNLKALTNKHKSCP